MNKRFTILMLLMVLFVPWAAKAQETKTIQVAPDRGGNRGTMTVYKRVSSLTSGRNYLIVSNATANSDALALSQVSSTASTITASYVHINSGISATNNAAYIADLADPTAVWRATSGWTFSHSKNGTTYYIYTDATYWSTGSLSASSSATDWTWSNNQLSYETSFLWYTTTYYITPSSTGFEIGTDAANVYLFEETSVTAYDVTASVSPSGIGRVTGAGQYPLGATCTLTASTFNSEYTFSNWTVNGTVVSTNPTYSFTVNEDLDVVANFESSVTCPSPIDLTAGTPYAHSVPLTWTSSADNFNVRYRTIGTGEVQTFFDSFENGLGNWTVIRDGGGTDATDWKQGPDRDNLYAHTGSYVAESRSWNTTAYSVDNWLITPQVTLDGILRFWAYGNGSYPDHYDVYVSTTGNSIPNFSLFYEPAPVTSSWTEVTVDLSSFNGVSGYIALRHTDVDKEYLMIDDFGIYAQSYGDWSQLVPADGTTFTLTGLESQTQYQAQVQANCGYELSGWSNNVNFTTTTPSTAAPTNLTVDINSITAHSATVSWQGVDANDSHQYYQVYYAESNVNSVPYSPAAPNLIDSITETTYTLLGLTSETEYHVWVRDYCGEDGYSAWTSYQTFTTAIACPSPTDVTVSDVTAHEATIEWVGSGDSYQYYQLYYADSTVTVVPDSLALPNLIDSISEAAYTLSGLYPETEYHVWVRAYCGDDGYSVWTSYQSFTTLVGCPSPTDVTVSDITNHGATIEWTGSGDSYQYYQLYYADSTVTVIPDSLAVTNLIDSISEAAYMLSGLYPETEYHVWVRAYCGEDGYSVWTTYQSFTTLVGCPSPTDVTVSDIINHGATIEWTGSGDSYQYYQLYYADSTVTVIPDSLAVTNLIDSISETTYTLSGLYPETEYHVWVRAYCGDDGYSAWTSYQSFTTLVGCPSPTDVTVSDVTAHEAIIEWTGSGDSYQYYQLYYADSTVTVMPDSLAVTNLIDSISETTYTLSGLYPETEYHVWVRAYCGDDGYSAWTSYQSFTTLVSCPSPTEVTVSDVTAHEATIEWTGSGDSYQYYQLYYADSTVTVVPDSLAVTNLIDSISEAAYTLSGLYPEMEYHVWVRAYCGDDGYSVWTSYQSFTTLESCPAPTGLAVVENSIYGHSATVSWDRVATQETGLVTFNYVCVASGDTLNWDNASIFIDDVDNPNPPTVSLTDLATETEYNFYVRKDCSEEGFSREVMVSFTTEIACPAPTDLAVVEDSITGHTATVSWTNASYGQQYYQLYYADSTVTVVPDSLAAPNLIDSISETSYTLSGLHSETEYHVWVRSYCGDDDGYSAWTSYQTFTTLVSCFPPTDVTVSDETAHGATIEWNGTSNSYLVMVSEPEHSITYSYDFEDGTSQGWTLLKGNEGTSPNNWMHVSAYPTSAYDISNGHGHNSSNGFMLSESYIYGETQGIGTMVTPDNYLVSPQVWLGGSITFYAGTQDASLCTEKFSVMVSTTGNDTVSNFTTVQTWTFTTTETSGTAWNQYTVDLSDFSGRGYIAIRHFDCRDQWLLCIDDITIESGLVDPSWMIYEVEESPFVFYDATNIHPESTYNIQVIGICGDEESRPSATTSFTTTIACPAPTELVVVENSVTGHGATLTWTGTSDNYNVYLGINNAPTLPNVDFSNGIPNNWNNDATYPWTVIDGYIKSGNAGVESSTSTISVTVTFPYNGTIEFDAECRGEGTSTFWDHCDFIIDGTTQLNAGANISGWNHYSYEVTAGEHTFTWSYTKDSSVNPTGDYFAIDNVMMILPPSIVWNDPISVENTEYTLSGLTSETTYYVKVQSDCGDDGVSTESNSVTFTTLISCPTPIPLDPTNVTSYSAVLNWTGEAESYNVSYYKTFFFDSFEEDLSQWTIYKEGNPESWEWGIENPHDNSADLNAHSGFFAAVAYSDIDVHADSWLVTPQIQFPNQTTLKFWIMRSTYDDAPDEYEVRLSTTGNAIEDFDVVLKEKEAANSEWTEVVIDLSAYDGQQGYIAIRHDYTGGFFIMVDDFGIYGWSEPIVTTDNSLLIEDLLPETEYQWNVQANCGEEDGLSHWSEISTFTTLRACPIPFYLETYDETAYGATIAWAGYSDSYVVMVKENEEEVPSYSYDFEDGTLQGWTLLKGNEGTSPNNWMHVSAYPTSAFDLSSGHGHNDSDGFMLSESYIYGETQTIGTMVTPDNYLVSPQVWLGGSITFYAGTQNASLCAEKFSVMVSTTGNDAVSNFTTVQTWTFSATESSGTVWKQYTVDLSDFSGRGYIAIRHFDCRDQWLLCIDDITIENGPVIPNWLTYESDASPFVLYDPEHLSAETTYLVKVKGFCDDEATEFSESITFTTLDESTKIFVTEGDWSDGDNWVPAGVPSIEQDVILRAEATVFDVAEANSITIEGTAALIIEDGGQLKTNADVEATMKKFIIGYGTDYVETDNGYYLMTLPTAVPIAAADAGLITEESDYDLYGWDRTATDEEWQNNHDGIDLQNGIGYLYANRDDMEMSFTATLRNSGEPVVVTPAYDEVEHGGWNLFGNPFPCEAYITTEAEGMTFYRLVSNELVPIEGAIAPLEAFFVKATSAGQTFTISREAPAGR